MSHLEILGYGTPDEHESFVKAINSFKYPYDGPLRKGKIAPSISEVKLYDIRIPDEHAEQFLKDIGAIVPETKFGKRERGMGLHLWKILMRFVRWFTPLKTVVPTDKPQMYKFPTGNNTWFYVFCLGKIKDTEQKDLVTGRRKEVL